MSIRTDGHEASDEVATRLMGRFLKIKFVSINEINQAIAQTITIKIRK